MWSELGIIPGLLLVVLTALFRSTVAAEAEHSAALKNVSSSLITESYLKASPSAVSTNPKEPQNTRLVKMKNPLSASEPVAKVSETRAEISTRTLANVEKASSSANLIESHPEIVVNASTMLVQISSSAIEQEASAIVTPYKRINIIHTLINVPQTHSVSVQTKSSLVKPDQQTGILKEGQMTRITIQPKIVSSIASFGIPEQSSVASAVRGKMNDTDGENEKREPDTVSTYLTESKMAIKSATPQILPSHGKTQKLNITVTIASQSYDTKVDSSLITKDHASHMSYTKIKVNAIYSVNKTVSEKLSIQVDAWTNTTVFLHPSPSLVTKQNRNSSNINVVLTKAARNMTKLIPPGNYTTVQHGIIKSSISFGYTTTMRINATKEKWPDKTVSKNDVFYTNTSKAMQTKVNVAATVNRTTIINNSSSLDLFSKTFNNETKNLKRLTTDRIIRPSSSLSLPSKAVINSTEEIQKPSSISVVTKIDISKVESFHSEVKPTTTSLFKFSTTQYSIPTRPTSAEEIQKPSSISVVTKIDVSKVESFHSEVKPTTTSLFKFNKTQYSTPTRPTSAATKLKEQQFLCTIKITSEVFKDEYITSVRAFRQKGREVAEEFDKVFKNMPEYLYTDVLRLFKGSLGCDVIIHTESVESQPVEKINDILHQAKNTKGGFGKFEVGDIDVKEKEPDVQGRDENDKSKTWGRMPLITISVLGGVCLVLFVIVISQCIQKRHYSHSLAGSNEIREYSPDIQLKYNDDSGYKDDERVPMTTFNQTDIY